MSGYEETTGETVKSRIIDGEALQFQYIKFFIDKKGEKNIVVSICAIFISTNPQATKTGWNKRKKRGTT